ncbi:hypothetical protein Dfri01_21740 [Dyadobacter frigoris]|uniref:glycosyltransferase family 2 protein n=1 Tax=Dyadobacter frigoris TaxID=2576211 RepID=UPI0024A08FBD|nr:glycosyltransferase [Dyadobacter frigoris]GLU52713.1 hypothetical protein Dfri01_21740 [Dyadobacter frigoris]
MPKVSVILPVFNGEQHIGAAVQSILDQSHKDFILNIIDDGSTDNTIRVLEKFDDKRIKITQNKQNIGLIDTLNKGLKLSSDSKFIARMDADDISVPKRLELQTNFLELNTNIDILGGASKYFGNSSKTRVKYQPSENAQIISAFLCQNSISHPTVMAKCEAFSQVIYDKNYPKYEDYALWINLINTCQFHNLSSVLLWYRRHNNNITNTYNEDHQNDFRLFSNIIKLLDNKLGCNFTETEILVISTITGRSRYDLHPNLEVNHIHDVLLGVLKKMTIERIDTKFLWTLLLGKVLKYLIYRKRFKDIFLFINLTKIHADVWRILKLQYSGK